MTDTMHDDNKVFYDGLRTITGIYANDSGKVGDKGTEGKFVVIELKHGANVDEAVICPYRATEYFQSTLLDLEYTVTQKKDIGTRSVDERGCDLYPGRAQDGYRGRICLWYPRGVSYRFFTPEKKAGEKYPLVIWLHGFGEQGTDNETHLRSNRGGVAWAEDEVQKENPCYVMSAQASAGSAWRGAGMVDDLYGGHPQGDRRLTRISTRIASISPAFPWVDMGPGRLSCRSPICSQRQCRWRRPIQSPARMVRLQKNIRQKLDQLER